MRTKKLEKYLKTIIIAPFIPYVVWIMLFLIPAVFKLNFTNHFYEQISFYVIITYVVAFIFFYIAFWNEKDKYLELKNDFRHKNIKHEITLCQIELLQQINQSKNKDDLTFFNSTYKTLNYIYYNLMYFSLAFGVSLDFDEEYDYIVKWYDFDKIKITYNELNPSSKLYYISNVFNFMAYLMKNGPTINFYFILDDMMRDYIKLTSFVLMDNKHIEITFSNGHVFSFLLDYIISFKEDDELIIDSSVLIPESVQITPDGYELKFKTNNNSYSFENTFLWNMLQRGSSLRIEYEKSKSKKGN